MNKASFLSGGSSPTVTCQISVTSTAVSGGTGTVTQIIAGTGLTGGTITTTGTIAVANPVANASTAGQGFLWLPNGNPSLTAVGATPTFTSNHTAAIQFVVPFAITFTKATIWIVATSNGNNYFAGIYSADGTTLIRQMTFPLGASAGVTVTATVASTTLTPGVYWLTWGADNATATVMGWGNILATNTNVFNTNVAHLGNSNALVSGGVLPATIGTISAAAINFPLVLIEP